MAIYGISGASIPAVTPLLPYATTIQTVCEQKNFPPCLAYAIAWRETIAGEVSGWISLTYGVSASARTVISPDGGHGLFQLTSSWPPDWADPFVNTAYAITHFLQPALHYYAGRAYQGEMLVRLVADSFNAGSGAVDSYLLRGVDPDQATTGGDYGAAVLKNYQRMTDMEAPL